jgi:hypothetical protein
MCGGLVAQHVGCLLGMLLPVLLLYALMSGPVQQPL